LVVSRELAFHPAAAQLGIVIDKQAERRNGSGDREELNVLPRDSRQRVLYQQLKDPARVHRHRLRRVTWPGLELKNVLDWAGCFG
jgi:hypothetical protein